jgi:two-component system nitrogen regulation sensor histidine kinase NtrY
MTTTFDTETRPLGMRWSRVSRLLSGSMALGVGLLVAILLSGAITYLTFTGAAPFEASRGVILTLVLFNLALVLGLAALVAWRLVKLVVARSSGSAGAKLHVRLAALFSGVAVIPAILVAAFASVTLVMGIEAWFSERVETVLNNAEKVSGHYLAEHNRQISADTLVIASRLDSNVRALVSAPTAQVNAALRRLASSRSVAGVYILRRNGAIIAQAEKEGIGAYVPPEATAFANLDNEDEAKGRPIYNLNNREDNYVRAIIKLKNFDDAYLYAVRPIDARLLTLIRETQDSKAEYEQAQGNRSFIGLVFALSYFILAFVVLLAAIWLGLWAATRIVEPIGRLVFAAERVSEGDLAARVQVNRTDDEIGMLGRAFNRMTGQLQTQRDELIEANRQYDRRRRFTEAVLSGVTAGVVGLDEDGCVTLANRSALSLLDRRLEDMIAKPLGDLVPDMAPFVTRARSGNEALVEGELELERPDGGRHLTVRVTSERSGGAGSGYVVTFDDITNLVAAQRMSAWADVARRIAHEIKNPLTPIQLSAERLKRKYRDEIITDKDVFAQCTDTIVRQVGDLQRMVDEFSAFARMPAPTIELQDLADIVRQAVFLQRVATPGISIALDVPEGAVPAHCDGRQVSQALINLIKNAGEAIEARLADNGSGDPAGRILVRLSVEGETTAVDVIDNGCGLPEDGRHQLTEPYKTTRAKGTGLGLAIVRKIMEDHRGRLLLKDAPKEIDEAPWEPGGAWIRLEFPNVLERPEAA